MSFSKQLQQSIEHFLNTELKDKLLLNEASFQLELAYFLKNNGYSVLLEYFVPELEENKRSYIDLVVKDNDDDSYIPIELKYKIKGQEIDYNLFSSKENIKVKLRSQGAQNIGRYDFWRDIYRLEQVSKRFSQIECAFAIFLTNDFYYEKHQSNTTTKGYLFSMGDNHKHGTKKYWTKDTSLSKERPNFELDNEYKTVWKRTQMQNVEYSYCLVKVE